MQKKPDILEQAIVAESRLFRVERLRLRFSNGVETEYERLLSPPTGAVLMVPMLDHDTVLLVREYAAGVDRYELALPKGRVEVGEDVLEAANRELMEEVGYAARHLEHLTDFTVSPGYLSSQTRILVARDLYEARLPGDEPEPLEVVPWRLSRLPELLQRKDCTEARSIAALFMVREQLLLTSKEEA